MATPERVPGLSNVTAISAGARHVIARLNDGTLRAWGNIDWGQVGNGAGPGFVLTAVAPKITNVRSVFAAGNATFVVKTDDTLWGWGMGNRGAWPFQADVRVPTVVDLP